MALPRTILSPPLPPPPCPPPQPKSPTLNPMMITTKHLCFLFYDDEDGDEMMLEDRISDDEVKENTYVSKFEHTYSADDSIFSANKMEDIRKR